MREKHCALFDCFLISSNFENIESSFCDDVKMKSIYCELCKCQEDHWSDVKETIKSLNKGMWQTVKKWYKKHFTLFAP